MHADMLLLLLCARDRLLVRRRGSRMEVPAAMRVRSLPASILTKTISSLRSYVVALSKHATKCIIFSVYIILFSFARLWAASRALAARRLAPAGARARMPIA
jgi:hypothetical protein